MPNLPDCASYHEDPNLTDYISGTANDNAFPRLKNFYADYRRWEVKTAPTDPQQMQVAFGGPDTPTDAFMQNRIREAHCQAFHDYIGSFGKPSALDAAGDLEKLAGKDLTQLNPFEKAVLAFALGLELTAIDRRWLHGACFLLNRAKQTSFTGTFGGETEFYAIPAYDVWKNQKDANDGLWRIVIEQLEAAANELGKPTINIDLAAQIRLGKRNDPILPSQSIGSGFVIFGFG